MTKTHNSDIRENNKNIKASIKNQMLKWKADALANKTTKTKKGGKSGTTQTPAHPEPVCDANGECCCPAAVAAKAVEVQNDAAKKTAQAAKKADHAEVKSAASAAKKAAHDGKKEAH